MENGLSPIGNCIWLLRLPAISLIPRLSKPKNAMSQTQPAQFSQPHSHTGYKLAIIALSIGVIVLGTGLALTTLPNTILKTSSVPPGFTSVHGTAKLSSLGGTVNTIEFRPTTTDTMSTTVSSDGSFQINLHTSVLYSVYLRVTLSNGNPYSCNAIPSTIIPTGSVYSQSFTNCGA